MSIGLEAEACVRPEPPKPSSPTRLFVCRDATELSATKWAWGLIPYSWSSSWQLLGSPVAMDARSNCARRRDEGRRSDECVLCICLKICILNSSLRRHVTLTWMSCLLRNHSFKLHLAALSDPPPPPHWRKFDSLIFVVRCRAEMLPRIQRSQRKRSETWRLASHNTCTAALAAFCIKKSSRFSFSRFG